METNDLKEIFDMIRKIDLLRKHRATFRYIGEKDFVMVKVEVIKNERLIYDEECFIPLYVEGKAQSIKDKLAEIYDKANRSK